MIFGIQISWSLWHQLEDWHLDNWPCCCEWEIRFGRSFGPLLLFFMFRYLCRFRLRASHSLCVVTHTQGASCPDQFKTLKDSQMLLCQTFAWRNGEHSCSEWFYSEGITRRLTAHLICCSNSPLIPCSISSWNSKLHGQNLEPIYKLF